MSRLPASSAFLAPEALVNGGNIHQGCVGPNATQQFFNQAQVWILYGITGRSGVLCAHHWLRQAHPGQIMNARGIHSQEAKPWVCDGSAVTHSL